MNVLLAEVYKYLDNLFPEFISKVFYLRQNHYNLNSLTVSARDNTRKNFLLSATFYRANLPWKILPSQLKTKLKSARTRLFEKMQPISLYWLQTSTFRKLKLAFLYLKFNAEFNELRS